MKVPAFIAHVSKENSPSLRHNRRSDGYCGLSCNRNTHVSVDMGYDLTADKVLDFAKQKHARLPECKDLKVLEANRGQINELKGAVEDFPVPNDFWVVVDGKPEIYRSALKSIVLGDMPCDVFQRGTL